MLTPVPPIARRHRPRPFRSSWKPFPNPPTLTAASYVTATRIELTFDRAVDVAGLIPDAFIVFDGPSSIEYHGTGTPTQPTPMQLHLDLTALGPTGGGLVMLTVYDGSGVSAVDGGAPLVGFAALELPYP